MLRHEYSVIQHTFRVTLVISSLIIFDLSAMQICMKFTDDVIQNYEILLLKVYYVNLTFKSKLVFYISDKEFRWK